MDLASIIGIAAGFILLIFGIVFGDTIEIGRASCRERV